MIRNKIVALVPARAGSKGLRNKNLLKISGKSITELAVIQGDKCSDMVILSTDIEDFFEDDKLGETIIHRRSTELSADSANMNDVILDVIRKYDLQNCTIVLLQPTSPLRPLEVIKKCIDKFECSDCELVMSVTETKDNGFKYGFIENGKFIGVRSQADLFKNRQELPDTYKPNGAVYVFNTDRIMGSLTIATDKIECIKMSASESIDIDCLSDYQLAKQMYEN